MIRQHHLIRGTIALAAALTASLAPATWADPAPLARAEATIAANNQSSTAVRPNPDEQTVTGATANPGPCSEVCSGGAGSYGSASRRSRTPNGSGATLPHDSRRWAAAPSLCLDRQTRRGGNSARTEARLRERPNGTQGRSPRWASTSWGPLGVGYGARSSRSANELEALAASAINRPTSA
jgi:hypothetical protein